MRKNKTRKINTSLAVVEYITIVDSIVNGYFDDITGEYQAHIGLINTMTLFYNNFYKTNLEEPITNLEDAEGYLNNPEFIDAYNQAISDSYEFSYNFSNAYRDAMDMVETRKMSFGSVMEGLSKRLAEIFNMMKPTLEEENIGNVLAIAKNLAENENATDAIFNSYDKSNRAKKMRSSSNRKNTSVQRKGKVVTLDHQKKKG